MQGSKGAKIGGIPENTYPIIKLGNPQKISTGATSVQSAAFSGTQAVTPTIVQLFATEDMFIEIGSSPVATTNSHFLAAGFYMHYNIEAGEKVAAIRASANGTLYISEGIP